MKKTSKQFEIIKDRELENLYYAVIREEWDDEKERTIIGSGETEQQAVEDALCRVLESHDSCTTIIDQIGGMLSGKEERIFDHPFYIPHKCINIPKNFGTNYEEGFSALLYCEKERKWFRFYR